MNTYVCSTCGHKYSISARAMRRGEGKRYFDACPKCGSSKNYQKKV